MMPKLLKKYLVILFSFSSPHLGNSSTSEWTLVDSTLPRTRSETYKNWGKQDNHELNGVAHFMSLIRHMIGSRKQVQDISLELEGIKVVGLLLQECDSSLINIGFLDSVAQFVESLLGIKDELLEAVYQYIVFDFQIWYDADISVQIAHTQLLHTYIKDDPQYFSNLFGIDFFFRVISLYYCGRKDRKDVRHLKKHQELSESDERDLRKALLGKFCMTTNMTFR